MEDSSRTFFAHMSSSSKSATNCSSSKESQIAKQKKIMEPSTLQPSSLQPSSSQMLDSSEEDRLNDLIEYIDEDSTSTPLSFQSSSTGLKHLVQNPSVSSSSSQEQNLPLNDGPFSTDAGGRYETTTNPFEAFSSVRKEEEKSSGFNTSVTAPHNVSQSIASVTVDLLQVEDANYSSDRKEVFSRTEYNSATTVPASYQQPVQTAMSELGTSWLNNDNKFQSGEPSQSRVSGPSMFQLSARPFEVEKNETMKTTLPNHEKQELKETTSSPDVNLESKQTLSNTNRSLLLDISCLDQNVGSFDTTPRKRKQEMVSAQDVPKQRKIMKKPPNVFQKAECSSFNIPNTKSDSFIHNKPLCKRQRNTLASKKCKEKKKKEKIERNLDIVQKQQEIKQLSSQHRFVKETKSNLLLKAQKLEKIAEVKEESKKASLGPVNLVDPNTLWKRQHIWPEGSNSAQQHVDLCLLKEYTIRQIRSGVNLNNQVIPVTLPSFIESDPSTSQNEVGSNPMPSSQAIPSASLSDRERNNLACRKYRKKEKATENKNVEEQKQLRQKLSLITNSVSQLEEDCCWLESYIQYLQGLNPLHNVKETSTTCPNVMVASLAMEQLRLLGGGRGKCTTWMINALRHLLSLDTPFAFGGFVSTTFAYIHTMYIFSLLLFTKWYLYTKRKKNIRLF